MAVALRVYNGDEKVTEFTNDDQPTVLALCDLNGDIADYMLVLPMSDEPALDANEDAILAWREAGGLSYDHNEASRAALIKLAQDRGDLAALAILGVGGRR